MYDLKGNLEKAIKALKEIRSQCEDPSPDIDAIHKVADGAVYDIEEGYEYFRESQRKQQAESEGQ